MFSRILLIAMFLGVVTQSVSGQEKSNGSMVQWILPTTPTNVPQTPEQAKAGVERGRELPEPEILQPRIDQKLPKYQPRHDINISGTFRGASSDVLVVLANKWFDKFRTYYPNVNLTITPPYAGSLGAVELVNDKRDFVFVSRELRPDDITQFNAKFGYQPLSVPISGGSYRHFGALDAVGFFVNKENPIEKISFKQIDGLFSKTRHRGSEEITTWGQLGVKGEWANKKVHLYGIKPWNGFEEFVRQRVLSVDGKRGEWRDDIHYEKLVFPMAKNIAGDPEGIGYSGLAYIDAPVKMIPIVVNEGDAAQSPSYENVALASYPLSRLIYLNLNKDPKKPLNPAIEEFLKFILSQEGQQIVLDHARYIPLRSEQADSARQLFK